MDDFLDQKIKESLTKGTEHSIPLKDTVWSNIKQNVNNGGQKSGTGAVNVKRPRYWVYTVAAAATLLLTFTAYTPEGQAAAKKIKQILLPEKSIVQDIEGEKEKTKVSLQESNIGYTIYIDKDNFKLVKEEGKDKIVPLTPPGNNLPPVFMEIYQVTDKNPDALLKQLEQQLKASYPEVKNVGEVKEPLKSLFISAYSGNNWNDTIDRYYLIDNTRKGTFVVRQHYFREAAEGYGARFYHMLKEFRLVTP